MLEKTAPRIKVKMDGLLKSCITLFVVMDPIGALPLFSSLTKGMPTAAVKKSMTNAVLVAGVLLFVFLFLFFPLI